MLLLLFLIQDFASVNTLCPVLVQSAILRVLQLAKQGEAGVWGSDQCPTPDGIVTLELSPVCVGGYALLLARSQADHRVV